MVVKYKSNLAMRKETNFQDSSKLHIYLMESMKNIPPIEIMTGKRI